MRVTVHLITRGRRTGQPREVELYAFSYADSWVVVGSRGGSPIDPRWAENLRAEPRAVVRLGGELRPVRAREVQGLERDRLWAMVCEDFATYRHYESKTKRLIPIFVLDPDTEPPPAAEDS